ALPRRPQQEVAQEPGAAPHEVVDGNLRTERTLYAARLPFDQRKGLLGSERGIRVGVVGLSRHTYFVTQSALRVKRGGGAGRGRGRADAVGAVSAGWHPRNRATEPKPRQSHPGTAVPW